MKLLCSCTAHCSKARHYSMVLNTMPTRFELYGKAFFSRGKNIQQQLKRNPLGNIIPKLDVRLSSVQASFNNVRKYADVCGFNFDGLHLPITFPYTLVFNLHLKLVTHTLFPLPAMGLVHIRNSITAYRDILVNETLDLHVSIGESRLTRKGLEFDIHSSITSNHQLVWESVSTNLYIMKNNDLATNTLASKHHSESPTFPHQKEWFIGKGQGRRYGWVSGDMNPIHLYDSLAKFFGFKQAITHGMLIKAQAAAHLSPSQQPSSALTISVEFKQPTPLGSHIVLNYTDEQESLIHNGTYESTFDMRSQDGRKLHMTGRVSHILG